MVKDMRSKKIHLNLKVDRIKKKTISGDTKKSTV